MDERQPDDTDPEILIPQAEYSLDAWLVGACRARGLRVIEAMSHRVDTYAVLDLENLHDMDLSVVGNFTPGAASHVRFESLFPVVASLRHPHLLQIFEMGLHEGRPYLLMQRIARGNWRDRVASGPMPIAEAVNVAIDLAWTVHFVHQSGLVGLDLMPSVVVRSNHSDRPAGPSRDAISWSGNWRGLGRSIERSTTPLIRSACEPL